MADFSEFTSDNNTGIITKADNNIGTDLQQKALFYGSVPLSQNNKPKHIHTENLQHQEHILPIPTWCKT